MALIPPDWLGYPEYRRVEFTDLERGNCPVCGAKGSNCGGETNFDHMIEFTPPKKPDPRATFTVPERVYMEQKIGSRVIRKLLYGVGDRITLEEAQRVGLI